MNLTLEQFKENLAQRAEILRRHNLLFDTGVGVWKGRRQRRRQEHTTTAHFGNPE